MLQDAEQRLARPVAGRAGGEAGRGHDPPAAMPAGDDPQAHPAAAGGRAAGAAAAAASQAPPICSRSTLAGTSSTERLGRRAELERAVGHADQPVDLEPGMLEHAAHLAVLALAQATG